MWAQAGLEGVLASLAWFVAYRKRSHAWLAAFVTAMALEGPIRWALRSVRSGPSYAYEGLALLSFHASKAVYLATEAVFVAACLALFTGRSTAPVWFVYALVWVLTLNHPLMSGETLLNVYKVVMVASLVATVAIIAYAVIRKTNIEPGLAHLVLMGFVALNVAVYVTAFVYDDLGTWDVVYVSNAILVSTAIIAHVGWFIRHRLSNNEGNGNG
jgi:hypothetical protein